MLRFSTSLALATIALLTPLAAAAQQRIPEIIDEKTLLVHVSGSGTVEYEPDRAYVGFAVRSFAATAAEATEASAVKMTSMREALKGAGIDDGRIRSTNFRLQPHYPEDPDTRQREPQPDGYTVYNMVDVTVEDVDKVGRVIDAAIGASADNVSNLRFGREDMRSIHREALKKAFQDAEDQARTLAEAAGKSLGTLVSVRTSPDGGVFPVMQAQVAYARATPTPIDPGTLSHTASVEVVFELR